MFSNFLAVPREALQAQGMSRHRLRVYNLMIVRSKYAKRNAYGGRISIARQLKITEQTAWAALSWLEAQGMIIKTWQSRGGRCLANIYRVVLAGHRAASTNVLAQTQKLSIALGSIRPSRKEKEVKVATENKSPPYPTPGSPLDHLRKIKNSLKSSI